jgi:hypothetical protein
MAGSSFGMGDALSLFHLISCYWAGAKPHPAAESGRGVVERLCGIGLSYSCGTFAQRLKTIVQRKAKIETTKIEVRAISFPDIQLLWSA